MNGPNSFFRSFRPLLVFSQVCGLMPLRGVFGPTPDGLRFSWTNPVHLYGFGLSAVSLFFGVFFTMENLKRDFAIDNFASTVFYSVCLITTLLFLRLAKKFPDIARDFGRIEKRMVGYGQRKGIRSEIRFFLAAFIVLATVEHGTMVVLHLSRAWNASGNGADGFGRTFYDIHFPAISPVLPYNGFLTVLLTWANAMCTFNWNYLDFFLVGISLEIIAKFEQINDEIKSLGFAANHNFWRKIYIDYGRIVLLTKKLDKSLSSIILTSFFSDLYHLSLQLLRSLRVSGAPFHKIYFYFSLSYLVLRLLTTLFFLAKVGDVGRAPKTLLFSLENHCVPSLRLLEQAITDDIHFTGSRFFVINRSFVVSVAGTIVTYQIVLLQFNSLAFTDT